MNLATGIDLIEIDRIREAIERHGDKFVARIFTQFEQRECNGKVSSLAARFAAKEAVAKALGCGIGDVNWLDIEIVRDGRGRPELVLHGPALALARELG